MHFRFLTLSDHLAWYTGLAGHSYNRASTAILCCEVSIPVYTVIYNFFLCLKNCIEIMDRISQPSSKKFNQLKQEFSYHRQIAHQWQQQNERPLWETALKRFSIGEITDQSHYVITYYESAITCDSHVTSKFIICNLWNYFRDISRYWTIFYMGYSN